MPAALLEFGRQRRRVREWDDVRDVVQAGVHADGDDAAACGVQERDLGDAAGGLLPPSAASSDSRSRTSDSRSRTTSTFYNRCVLEGADCAVEPGGVGCDVRVWWRDERVCERDHVRHDVQVRVHWALAVGYAVHERAVDACAAAGREPDEWRARVCGCDDAASYAACACVHDAVHAERVPGGVVVQRERAVRVRDCVQREVRERPCGVCARASVVRQGAVDGAVRRVHEAAVHAVPADWV